jgi:FkbM family methyltransferase
MSGEGWGKIQGMQFHYLNREEWFSIKREVFGEQLYYAELKGKVPLILDLGAHVGLSVGYFKRLYPKALIVAVEPNPTLAKLLRENIEANGWQGVEVVEAAIGTGQQGTSTFYIDREGEWLSTGSLNAGAWNGQQATNVIDVPVIPLADLLEQPVDLIKMDIEGVEEKVLLAAGDKIKMVKTMMIEYHPRNDNRLVVMREFLIKQGFEVTVWQKGKAVEGDELRGLALIEVHQ